ncbi:hypothetical protein DPMN_141961 [Dreissena polymorpha]|uniref:EGF-like domain-containing protein n=1 Tax=Dreissena polymorpha TaxID=45954 RepID=A0A9D4JIR7_DREPO|nr:hypothetical protein DPMN_141961 [Dreissena polymorpha]
MQPRPFFYTLGLNYAHVSDTDECSNNPCSHGATCKNTVGGFVCECAPGWTGPLCTTDENECSRGHYNVPWVQKICLNCSVPKTTRVTFKKYLSRQRPFDPYVPLSQIELVHPSAHTHRKEPKVFSQRPPFRHGPLIHVCSNRMSKHK